MQTQASFGRQPAYLPMQVEDLIDHNRLMTI
jgi:hypothetical protein